MSDVVLQVQGVSKRFGGLQALSDVGIRIQKGQVYGLIGPNGAGKTTFFNVITGLYTPDSGTFDLGGAPYKPTAVHEVAKAGIARTFQNIRLFAEMTALENVMVGRHVRSQSGLLGAILPNVASVGAGNAAGVIGYCLKNKFLGGTNAKSVLGKLTDALVGVFEKWAVRRWA